ncbi:MAG: helix-turn-helix transcriptional regulator [Acetobacteraceae bacterium]
MEHESLSETGTARVALETGSADPEPAGRPIPRDPDALLFGAEMAYLLGLSVRTLEGLRLRGGGPPYIKLLRSVRYRRGDGLAWAAGKLRRSTSDRGEAA